MVDVTIPPTMGTISCLKGLYAEYAAQRKGRANSSK